MREELTLTDIITGEDAKNAWWLSMIMWDIPNTMNAVLRGLEQNNILNATMVIPTDYRIVHKSKVKE